MTLWWLLHEHPAWSVVHLVVAGVLLPRGVAVIIAACRGRS